MNKGFFVNLCLMSAAVLSGCSGDEGSQDGGPSTEKGGASQDLTRPDAVLVPEDKELLGRCTFASVQDEVCDEFFTVVEQSAAEVCLPADDVGSLDNFWTVGGECPRENLVAACVTSRAIRYYYFGASRSVEEVQESCSGDSKQFYRFAH